MDRRRFTLQLGAATASIAMPRLVCGQVAPWAPMPDYATAGGPIWATPPDLRILEIHLYGGLSMWESFYVRPPSASDRYRGYAELLPGACGSAYTPLGATAFANDAAGRAIHLGPVTAPLNTPAILSRMRIVALRHHLKPHEAAIPLALTGFELGSPKLAGLGAVIQHYHASRDLAVGTNPARPYSYVCWPDTFRFASDNLQASAASGTHPAYAKPLVMRIGPATARLLGLLERADVRAQRDAVLNHYIGEYRDQLRHAAIALDKPARSRGFVAFESSAGMLAAAPALRTLLSATGSPLAGPFTTSTACPAVDFSSGAAGTAVDNMPAHAIRLAAFLLAQTGPGAPRYACVIDKGLHEHGMGGGYDTHGSEHMNYSTVNLWNVLVTLRQLIDAGTLDLSRTMIVLSTEFGRTTDASRDHWPQGFCNVLIGGPVVRGISGALRDAAFGAPAAEDGQADATPAPAPTPLNPFPVPRSFTPPDLRAAILVAANIYPFADEGFAVRDISFAGAGSDHRPLMMALKIGVLGAAAGA